MEINKERILVFLMAAIIAVSIMQTIQAFGLSTAVASLKSVGSAVAAPAASAGGGIGACG